MGRPGRVIEPAGCSAGCVATANAGCVVIPSATGRGVGTEAAAAGAMASQFQFYNVVALTIFFPAWGM